MRVTRPATSAPSSIHLAAASWTDSRRRCAPWRSRARSSASREPKWWATPASVIPTRSATALTWTARGPPSISNAAAASRIARRDTSGERRTRILVNLTLIAQGRLVTLTGQCPLLGAASDARDKTPPVRPTMTRLELQRPNGTLIGEDAGAGPALLLLHAGGESRAVWAPVAERL